MLLLISNLALASVPIPEGKVAQSHTLMWSLFNNRWEHNHATNCGPQPGDYWQGSPPSPIWNYGVGPHGLAGTYDDLYYLDYTICDDVPEYLVDRVESAFDAYRRSGVAAVPSAAYCANMLATPDSDDDPVKPSFQDWFLNVMPDGERRLDEIHGVRFASSDTSFAYYWPGVYWESQNPPVDPIPGFTVTGRVQHFAGHYDPAGPRCNLGDIH